MLLITGGTGFVGGYVLEALEDKVPRNQVRILARGGDDLVKLGKQGYDTVAGSVTNKEEIAHAMRGVDTVLHLVAIIREDKSRGQTFDRVIGEGTENVVGAAKAAGVKRFIFMSALGAPNASTPYFRNKIRGEQAVKASGIPYTIFRPSFLIGPGGEFTALLKQLTMLPVVPVLGPGNYPVQPVYVRDMARNFAQAIDDERYMDQTFEFGGPETFEYNDMLRQTLDARGKKGFLFHAPLPLVKPVVPVIDRVLPKLITKDQFTMLLEGSSTSDTRLREIGGFDLTPFRQAIEIALKMPPPATYAKAKARPAAA
ncbi:MAG TPA: NAD(P)H-binding protein [Chloroflexia bacterium]|nr:NAD(P)H-binding protein [Chloroflexia bacterium]